MKQHHHWQNQSVSSSRDATVLAQERQNNLETMQFKELISEPISQQSSVMFKLTDECCAAINKAVAKRRKIRIHYFKDSCVFEVGCENGESKRFDCTVHLIGYPIDSITFNKENNKYQTISTLNNKIQVRATDKTFAETREKAQKLVEEQQKRKIKDMNNSKIHKRIQDVRNASNPPAALAKRIGMNSANSSASQKFKQAVSIKPSNALPPNVLSGMKSSNVPGSRSTSDTTRTGVSKSNEFNKTESTLNRSVQKNETLRNSFPTSQKNSPSFGGFVPASNNNSSSFSAPNNNSTSAQSNNGYGGYSSSSTVSTNPTFRKRQYPLSQQQQSGSPLPSSKLTPGRSSDTISPPISNLIPEKRRVSSLTNQQNNHSNNTNNSFVSAENIQTIQPLETTPSLTPSSAISSIDSPNSLYSGSGGKSSLPQYQNINQSSSSQKSSTGVNSLQTDSAASSTNWRQSSLSPDENIDKFQRNGRSLTMPTKPSCDWSQVFGQIENLFDAKKYHEIFSSDYPEYCDCYRALFDVAKEFTDLEKALKSTPVNTPGHDKMEEAIQTKFAKYQCDEDFLSKRQKHTDLRAKLEILKQRIIDWENIRRGSSNGNHHVSWSNQTASTKKYIESGKVSSHKGYNQNEQKHLDQRRIVSTNFNESNGTTNNRSVSLTDLMEM